MALRQAVSDNAYRFAEGLVPVLADIRAKEQTVLRAVAAGLNRRRVKTRGSHWQVPNVRNLMERLTRAELTTGLS